MRRLLPLLLLATVARADYLANNYKSWTARSAATVAETTPESPCPNILIATPASPLPVGKNWRVSLATGLPNLTANARTIEESSYEVGDITPFAVSRIASYVVADEPRKIVINFNQPIAEKLPDDFLTSCVTITPRPENLSAEIEDNEIALKGNFATAEKYSVTITASNDKGSPKVTEDIEIKVFPERLAGSYTGIIPRNAGLNGDLGGRLDFTLSSLGSLARDVGQRHAGALTGRDAILTAQDPAQVEILLARTFTDQAEAA
mgnify:CR=1 FL=1